MEMQEIQTEPESRTAEDAGAAGPEPEVKAEEEAESYHYAKLQTPAEDVYSETYYLPVKSTEGKQPERSVRLYRAACLLLALLCFILLLAVIILSVKLQAGSTSCQNPEEALDSSGRNLAPVPTCSLDQCQLNFPHFQPQRLGCQQCSNGWLTHGRSCFYLSTFRLSWAESQRNCSSRGGNLAVISSDNVQTFLTKKGDLIYWIGLKNIRSTWTWVNNTVLQQSYWSERLQPGDCGILNSNIPAEKNWIRASCEASAYFICQLQF